MRDYDVCCTDKGISGIQKAFEYNPDVIICDIRMEPIDGYHVYNVLKESSLTDSIPFIFMTGFSEIQESRYGMNLGADDFFIKPFDNDHLILSIEKRLSKFRKLKEIGRREFMALFNITPHGIFLFDGHFFIEANPVMIRMLGLKKDLITSSSIVDFLDPDSYKKIKERILACTRGMLEFFQEPVTFISGSGDKIECVLYISAYEKYSGYTLMVGLLTIDSKNNFRNGNHEVSIPEILKVLQSEKITVTPALGEKLTEVFQQHRNGIKKSSNGFFSDREHEVLRLSMEGLPTKMIADKLSISDRTVEKHRARLMEKTNTKNMIEVIVYALKNNLININ
jgi:PAS domain S-box-containing protein